MIELNEFSNKEVYIVDYSYLKKQIKVYYLTKCDNICHYDEEDDLDINKLSLRTLDYSKEKIINESDNEDNKFKFEYNLSENMSLSEDWTDDIEDNILQHLKDIDKYSLETQKSKSFNDEDLNYILEK